MGGTSDMFNDFLSNHWPLSWVADKFRKVDHVADSVLTGAGNAADAASGLLTSLNSLLSGNSNILLYAGIGIVAIVIVPIILQKVL